MNTVYDREDYLGADEYIDVVRKSGLNRPVEDRGRVERYLKHSNLFFGCRGPLSPNRAAGFQIAIANACRLETLLALMGLGLPAIAALQQLGNQNPCRRPKRQRRSSRPPRLATWSPG